MAKDRFFIGKDGALDTLGGFLMALADSVPGVSGGTIAFIIGIYDDFVWSLDKLIYGHWQEKKKAIIFLVKLLIGWVIGIALAAVVLSSLF
ncbi:MAG: DUF368 domain-containing protein, partial [Eggerthellaceae bacterium]|nr:DUF368 domain-containing protein [Eggerthellaceae bacterium]